MKNRILLESYYLLGQLEQSIGEFVEYYNDRRYHESLGQPDAGRRLLRQGTGHTQTKGSHQTKDHTNKDAAYISRQSQLDLPNHMSQILS